MLFVVNPVCNSWILVCVWRADQKAFFFDSVFKPAVPSPGNKPKLNSCIKAITLNTAEMTPYMNVIDFLCKADFF